MTTTHHTQGSKKQKLNLEKINRFVGNSAKRRTANKKSLKKNMHKLYSFNGNSNRNTNHDNADNNKDFLRIITSNVDDLKMNDSDPLSHYNNITANRNARARGELLFSWLIHPLSVSEFFNKHWEKKPLYIQRSKLNYYSHIFSTQEFDDILRTQPVDYSVNLDVTEYISGERHTLNPEGRAYPSAVWKFYNEGCSLRLLNPQSFSTSVWWVCSTLQDYFKSFVGANMYLTPPNSQGFAPHYDDIEAFILQIEGCKKWKLHSSRNDAEVLARVSSGNFTPSEISSAAVEVVLHPGDLLYFPRGVIHQANTVNDLHSLHITLSTYQKNSWGDYFKELLPLAISNAIERNVEFRKGLPLNYTSCIGSASSKITDNSEIRKQFHSRVVKLLHKLEDYIDIDTAADKISLNFIEDSLPPCLTEDEKLRSVTSSIQWKEESQRPVTHSHLAMTSSIRLLRPDALKFVRENGLPVAYHTAENSRIYHQKPLQSFDLTEEVVPAILHLLKTYPDFIIVQDLPCHDEEDKLSLSDVLFSEGLIEVQTDSFS